MIQCLNLYINHDYQNFHGLEDYLEGVHKVARELTFDIHLHYRSEKELKSYLKNTNKGSDPIGIIGFDPIHHAQLFNSINEWPKNCFIINKYLSDIRSISSISIDYIKASQDITTHMLENCKCRKIACLGFDPLSPLDKEKLIGHQSALESAKINADHRNIYYNVNNTTTETIKQLLQHLQYYDGVLASTDAVAILFLNQTKKAGIQIPKDIVLASFDGIGLGKHLIPSITTVSPNYYDIGEATVRLSSFMIHNPQVKTLKAICDHQLIIRESTNTMNISPARKFTDMPNDLPELNAYISSGNCVLQPNVQIFSEQKIESIERINRLFSHASILELEILESLLLGLYYKEISAKLNVSERSVKYRVKRMLNSINITSQSSLKMLFHSHLSMDLIDWKSLIHP